MTVKQRKSLKIRIPLSHVYAHWKKKTDDKSLLDLPNFKSNVHVYTLPKAAVE